MHHQTGRHFLQIPGPTNVPDRILRAISKPPIDHRGPEFSRLCIDILEGLKRVFKTSGPLILYPGSGSGALEAALVNTLSTGDKVLMFETGYFAVQWALMAGNLGLKVDLIPGDWRTGVDSALIEQKLREDSDHHIKAVAVVHNETSTGVLSDIEEIRKALDRAAHPALLLVDTISSLAIHDYCHDKWGVDVTISSSQKGLMVPSGVCFNAVSEKAMKASRAAGSPRSYWSWEAVLGANKTGYYPYTPATNLLYGLKEALNMLQEEGLEKVFARHFKYGEATRRAIETWGFETVSVNTKERSNSVTAVLVPEACDADEVRKVALEKFNLSLATGLGKWKGKSFRIGHLGDFNDLMLMGTLSGVEISVHLAGIPIRKGGITAALEYLISTCR